MILHVSDKITAGLLSLGWTPSQLTDITDLSAKLHWIEQVNIFGWPR